MRFMLWSLFAVICLIWVFSHPQSFFAALAIGGLLGFVGLVASAAPGTLLGILFGALLGFWIGGDDC